MILPLKWLINILEVLPFKFQQSFDPFAMLFFWESSETGPFRPLSNHFFWSQFSGNTSDMTVIFFGKCLKFNVGFKNAKKNWEKFFVFEAMVSDFVALNSLY